MEATKVSSLSWLSPDRSGNSRILICEPRMTSTDGLSVPTASSGSQTLMQWPQLVAAASASMCHRRIPFVPLSRGRKDRNAKKCQPSPKTLWVRRSISSTTRLYLAARLRS